MVVGMIGCTDERYLGHREIRRGWIRITDQQVGYQTPRLVERHIALHIPRGFRDAYRQEKSVRRHALCFDDVPKRFTKCDDIVYVNDVCAGDTASRRERDTRVNMRPIARSSKERTDMRVTDLSVEDQICFDEVPK